jgi:hypothetical protein
MGPNVKRRTTKSESIRERLLYLFLLLPSDDRQDSHRIARCSSRQLSQSTIGYTTHTRTKFLSVNMTLLSDCHPFFSLSPDTHSIPPPPSSSSSDVVLLFRRSRPFFCRLRVVCIRLRPPPTRSLTSTTHTWICGMHTRIYLTSVATRLFFL